VYCFTELKTLQGGTMADRKFLDFLDMIDGGGAGQMGDKFEGGGLYSALGNLVASPFGSQDEERKKARMAAYGSDDIGGPPLQAPPPVGTVGGGAPASVAPPTEQERYGMNPPAAYTPPAQSPLEMFGGMDPAPYSPEPQYGGRGTVGMPSPDYATSGMNPTTAYVDPRQRFAQDLVDMYGPEMADTVMNSGIVEDTYRGYVDRGYRF
jgi:hypothetical protein